MRNLVLALLMTGCLTETEIDAADPETIEVARVVGWTAPSKISAVSALGAYDSDPAVSADGLELFFISDRDGPRQIYVSTRASTTSPWGVPIRVTTLAGMAGTNDSGPELSHDGYTIWFSRAQLGVPGPAIYTATRPIRSPAFNPPTRVTELDPMPVESPHVSRDGLKMYFTRADPTNFEIYSATRPTVDATWRNVRAVTRFNSLSYDAAITTARGDREAYFESRRGGDLAIYRSTRTIDTAWSIPEVVEDLPDVSRPDVTPDGLYMVMTVVPIFGEPDIYESRRF